MYIIVEVYLSFLYTIVFMEQLEVRVIFSTTARKQFFSQSKTYLLEIEIE